MTQPNELGAADSTISPQAFSLLVAGRVEHESLEVAQELLEMTSTVERLRALDDALAEAVSFTSTQLMLQRLGMGAG